MPVSVCTNVFMFVSPSTQGVGVGVQGWELESLGKVGVQEVGSPRGWFTWMEGDQRRWRSSGLDYDSHNNSRTETRKKLIFVS